MMKFSRIFWPLAAVMIMAACGNEVTPEEPGDKPQPDPQAT